MRIPFTKAHGAKNDFLLTWAADAPGDDLPAAAIAICDRHTGAGADGWLIVSLPPDGEVNYDARIRLFNPDGSEVEMSGNGTRCAAAFLIDSGVRKTDITILTGAGRKQMNVLEADGLKYNFEMNMGRPKWNTDELHYTLALASDQFDCTILNVGNPQCAVFVSDFSSDWRAAGAGIERHPHFPNRTNVSFVLPVDEHTIDVRFFERGAGETMSSGTGSTGAAASAVLRGLVKSPVRVLTPAGSLELKWDGGEGDVLLIGPAEIVARGEFYY
jgi:diaminopimelate epimerase